MGEVSFEDLELLPRMMGVKNAKIVMQRLVTPRFARLPLQGTDLTFYFLNDVANAQEICLGRFQLAQRLAFLRLVFCDSCRFFKNYASVFGARAQNHIDLALFHHGVRSSPNTCVGEEILDVAQSTGRFVQQVFGVAIAIDATGYAHVVPVDTELLSAIRESQ